MANLILKASGNISGAGGNCFATCETAANAFNFIASGLLVITNTQTVTTSKLYSPTFTTTNGAVYDGVLLYLYAIGSTGTLTVYLNNGTTDVASVTVNVADISTTASLVFFKFTGTATGDGTANWKIGIATSNVSQITVYRATATANDYYKALRTTTVATPASNDHLFIISGLTGQGTNNSFTVTMDFTSNTIAPGQIDIGYYGVLQYGVAASTNYYLRTNGYVNIWSGGTLNIGTSGTLIPANSTAILEFNCTSNVQYGLEVQLGATFNTGGQSKYLYTHLNGDVNAGATALATADNVTGWAIGDTIVIAPTSTTYSQTDAVTISSIAGTAITCPALTYAHFGTIYTGTGGTTFDCRAEIINLTRNVKIRGMSTALQSYINIGTTAIVNCYNTEFYWLGSAIANKRGIDVATTTGSCTFNGCSEHDCVVVSSIGINFNSVNNNNYTLTNNVSYNCYTNHIATSKSSLTSLNNFSITNCVAIYTPPGGSHAFNLNYNFAVFSNIVVAGSVGAGISLNGGGFLANITMSNITTHSCANFGVTINGLNGVTLSNLVVWRNVGVGGIVLASCIDTTFNNMQSWGNNNCSLLLSTGMHNVFFNNCVCDAKAYAGDTFVETQAINNGSGGQAAIIFATFNNCISGQSFPHQYTASGSTWSGLTVACNFMSYDTALFNPSLQTNMATTARMGFQALNGIAGNHQSVLKNGFITVDTTIYDIGPSSERLTPNGGAGNKLLSGYISAGVNKSTTIVPSIKVRCSATGAGDSTSYNGAAPRLILKQNISAGIATDTVLATLDVSYLPGGANQGVWATLSARTPTPVTDDAVLNFIVDCDGTAGWINVDSATVA